ncbi:Hypothetical predicted protein [Pelobates cultripes]|uniref:Uncharacterized protein n=1 Tax=Pelobates cultripes TaxID=61616 RepID=A0AAD1WX86_PELCU|nr:Hypothetical predicted protein [Pelobates cultripes]
MDRDNPRLAHHTPKMSCPRGSRAIKHRHQRPHPQRSWRAFYRSPHWRKPKALKSKSCQKRRGDLPVLTASRNGLKFACLYHLAGPLHNSTHPGRLSWAI